MFSLLASLQKLIPGKRQSSQLCRGTTCSALAVVCMLSQSGAELGSPALIGTSEPRFYFLPDWEVNPYRDLIGWTTSELEAHDNLLEAFFVFPAAFYAVIFPVLCLISSRTNAGTYGNILFLVPECLRSSKCPRRTLAEYMCRWSADGSLDLKDLILLGLALRWPVKPRMANNWSYCLRCMHVLRCT